MTIPTDALHLDVETHLGGRTWYVQAVIHALVDAGRVTSWECMADRCIRPSRALDLTVAYRHRDSPSLDHIEERQSGGLHRLDNLRLIHHACNSARTLYRRPKSPEHMARIREGVQASQRPGVCPKCQAPFWDLNRHPVDQCTGLAACGHPGDQVRLYETPTRRRRRCLTCNRESVARSRPRSP